MDYKTKKYICRYKKEICNDKELYEFIKKSFPDISTEGVQGSYFAFCIFLLAYVCYPLSMPELASMLGKYFATTTNRSKLTRFAARGNLKSYDYGTSDMGAKSAFYLSQKKGEELLSQIPQFFSSARNPFRKTAGKVPVHDYATGMSLLQIMLLERPFTYQKEVGFTPSSTYKKSKNSLCVDAVVSFQDGEMETYYIEQDMGTEPIYTLCNKLSCYEKYGLARKKGALLFSSHSIQNLPTCPSYNATMLKRIQSGMREEMLDSLYDYYICDGDILSEKERETLICLMVRCDAAEAYDEHWHRLSAEHAGSALHIKQTSKTFTLNDLDAYIMDLSMGVLEMRVSQYNMQQDRIATNKFRNMCQHFRRLIQWEAFDRGEIRFLLSGFPCLVYPTVFLSHASSYLSFENKDAICKTLTRYYDGLKESSYCKRGTTLYLEEGLSICFNNVFILPDGRRVCVEHIGKDVSAFVRFYYFYYMRDYHKEPIHLIGIGSEEDILFLASQFDYFPSHNRTIPDNGYFLSFLLEDGLYEEGALYLPYKGERDEKILLSIAAPREERLRRERINSLSAEERARLSPAQLWELYN